MGRLKDILFNPELSAAVQDIQRCSNGMELAYAETYQILLHATQEVTSRIPTSFMEFFRENMDATRSNNLDFSKNLMEMELLRTTQVLLSLVYRDFLCSEAERKELVEKDRKEIEATGKTFEDESLRDLFKVED